MNKFNKHVKYRCCKKCIFSAHSVSCPLSKCKQPEEKPGLLCFSTWAGSCADSGLHPTPVCPALLPRVAAVLGAAQLQSMHLTWLRYWHCLCILAKLISFSCARISGCLSEAFRWISFEVLLPAVLQLTLHGDSLVVSGVLLWNDWPQTG